jgi:predicted DNA-binding protein with PD1-like motif
MKYFVFGPTYVIRLDAGEKIIESLRSLCEQDKITAGFLNGLGAVREAELGWFDGEAKDYRILRVQEPCEITLTRFFDEIDRKKDAASGLYLLDLKPEGD